MKWPTRTLERCAGMKRMQGFTALLAVLLCLASPAVGAVSLGHLTVRSGLGERFWAELPLIGRDFTIELKVSFGTEQDYLALGLEKKEVVGDIVPLFSVEEATRIYLYSLREVHEPSFDLIVKIHTSEGRVARAYHIQLAEEDAAYHPGPLPREERAVPPPAPPEETPSPGPTRRHPYVIHIASYREPALARSQVEELRARGTDAFMALGRIPQKGLFYRVFVGRYSTRREATEYISRLKEVVQLPYYAPLKLPYSVGIAISAEEAVVRRGYSLRLVPGRRFEEEGRASALLLGAYATHEEAAALSAALTRNGIPARVVMP